MMMTELNHLQWVEELLPHDIQSLPKHGGMAYYLDGLMVLILVEHENSTYEHKGVTYPFDLWRGCIFPIEQKKQSAFFLKYLFLENHPVNKHWLYIPMDSENFEDEVKQVLKEISKRNPLLGIPVKETPLTAPVKGEKPAAKKKTAKKVKADKKTENSFLLSMMGKKK